VNVLSNTSSLQQAIDFTQASAGQITMFDSAPLSAVPLPAAAWLFLSGLLGLAGLARRNRHS